ncbi:MAG: hypothetical protein RLZZ577_676 [Bacteroidota bacterium]|jgi:hypothetical protein
MVEFGAIEIAIGKGTLNKSNSNKITSGKITIDELTRLKFFEIHFFFTISGVLVGQIKEVGCHKKYWFRLVLNYLFLFLNSVDNHFYVFLKDDL